MVEMFATIGMGQWFRYVVGALEIAGAVGVLIPRLSGLAALGLVCLMEGATATNVLVLGASPLLPIGLLLVSAVVAWGCRAGKRPLPKSSGAELWPPVKRPR
jgi:putative oxidoreductase